MIDLFNDDKINVFADADFANEKDRKFVGSNLIKVLGVFWKSKKQLTGALSTTWLNSCL